MKAFSQTISVGTGTSGVSKSGAFSRSVSVGQGTGGGRGSSGTFSKSIAFQELSKDKDLVLKVMLQFGRSRVGAIQLLNLFDQGRLKGGTRQSMTRLIKEGICGRSTQKAGGGG